MNQIRAVLFGSGDFALGALAALQRPPFSLIAIVTRPDRPFGRGRHLSPTPVKAAAKGIRVLKPERAEEAREALLELRPDVIVICDYGEIIPGSIIDLGHIVNLHPSLLPRYRGATPLQSAILHDDSESGLTLIELDEKLDHGAIIAQKKVPISGDNVSSLNTKIMQLIEPILRENLPKYLSGDLRPVPQDDSAATYCEKLTKNDGKIDWSRSASEILRRIRALTPWPGTYTSWSGKQLTIIDAEVSLVEQQPGQVGEHQLIVGTSEGSLRIRQLQMEGRRPLTDKEFLAGHPEILGSHLG